MKNYLHTCIGLCMGSLVSLYGANITYAQKPLKYVPQAFKGASAVPYVVKLKVPFPVRAQFAMPVIRPVLSITQPNLAANVERAVSASVTTQERISRLERNLSQLENYARTHNNRLPKQNFGDDGLETQVKEDLRFLDYPTGLRMRYDRLRKAAVLQIRIDNLEANLTRLEEYVSLHNNELPMTHDGTDAGTLRKEVVIDISCLKRYEMESPVRENSSLFRRYEQLVKNATQFVLKQKAEERADVTAATVARMAEDNLSLEIGMSTEDFVEDVLRFYNKLDPWGTGTIQKYK